MYSLESLELRINSLLLFILKINFIDIMKLIHQKHSSCPLIIFLIKSKQKYMFNINDLML